MSHSPTAACARVTSRLDRWIDGALEATEAALDRGHMEACFACAEERDRRVRLLERIRLVTRADTHEVEGLWEGLVVRLEDARPVRRRLRYARLPALLGAAASILALFLLQVAGGERVRAPQPEDLVSVQHVLDALPGWSDVVRGVGSLSRSFS